MGCRHCEYRKAAKGKRGLCAACYEDRAVRRLYLSASKYAPLSAREADEPTLADLDAVEAEQRKCLPAWWAAHTAYMRWLDAAGLIPSVRRE
jgi:hypothetical protein